MKHLIYLLIAGLCVGSRTPAAARNACADAHRQRKVIAGVAKTAIASPFLEQYDIRYVKLDLALSNVATSVSGNATTRATVVATAGMGRYAFELSDKLTIDSFKLNGALLSVSTISPDVKVATLPATLGVGATFTAQVFYHGNAAAGTGFFTHALNLYVGGGYGDVMFTVSDPYLAKEWWPCKQSLTDKIDSADLWLTVPAGTKAGSNGRLMVVTPVGAASRYEWKTRYPIEYYLISASVANYVDRSQMLHFSGSTDSMPVQHYIYNTPAFPAQNIAAMDSTPYMVDYLSTLYGRYPFWKEKYGHCTAPLGGGMEHQTMTTLGAFTTPLIAHELGHQWWGDCVTYSSWLDIWMSEGWASYTEQLYVEHFHSAAAAQSYRTGVFNRVMTRPGGTVYVDDTTDAYRIFDSRLTYDKGAAVAHMLRYLAPSDSVFFSGLRAYQQRYAYSTATTDSFRKVMETAYARPLDTFFNQWIMGEGYPTYGGSWNQRGNDVFVQLTQSTSVPSSVAAFALPVVLQLKSPAGDTLVKVYLNSAQQTYHFTWANAMTGFSVDPQNDIVNKTSLITNDPTLAVSGPVGLTPLSISPNPAADSWQVSGLESGCRVRLTDAAGRLLWEERAAATTLSVSSRHLPAGIYTLQVRGAGKTIASYKLEHR